MNKRALFAVVAAGSLLLTGCGGLGDTPTDPANSSPVSLTQCLTDAADSVSTETSANTTGTIRPSTGFAAGAKIGISLPQKTSQNWVEAQSMFKYAMGDQGFTAIVAYATGGVEDQQAQIDDMVRQGVAVLVVGALDGSQLDSQLSAAKAAGIPVIAYDRLLTQTEAVDMYVAYDNYKVGQLQGQAIVRGMLAAHGEPPFNIELIAGSPNDANSTPFFEGAMSVLQPGIDCGALSVPSGQLTQDEIATEGWLASNVQLRMDELLSNHYADARLHGILAPNDTLARAALASLSNAGLAGEKTIVSGQDSETASIQLIMQGTQYMTIYKSTQVLVDSVAQIVGLLQKGEPVPVNDTANNGVLDVPTYYLAPQVVTATNAAQVYVEDPVRVGCTKNPPVNCQQ